MTRGPMLSPDELASTDNVTVAASAPHRQVLSHASLVVSHCGRGTTIKALAVGCRWSASQWVVTRITLPYLGPPRPLMR